MHHGYVGHLFYFFRIDQINIADIAANAGLKGPKFNPEFGTMRRVDRIDPEDIPDIVSIKANILCL